MSGKSFILSASGLKNLVLTENDSGDENVDNEDIFRFIFGKIEIKMNKILADFISPRVSRGHSADPTMNQIDFTDTIKKIPNSNLIFTPDLINIFAKISIGDSVEVDVEMSHKLRILSILLENQEMFEKINEIYPFKNDKTNIDSIIKYFNCYDCFDSRYQPFNSNSMIDIISSNFYSLDKSTLLNLSKPVLYSIISNDQLKLENEDSLLDFINQMFTIERNNDDSDGLTKTAFYELVDFSELSGNKFKEFINNFNLNDLSSALWQQLTQLMTLYNSKGESKAGIKKNPNRYAKQ